MSGPVRIQLSRRKGWRMPANTVKVDRSTGYGNAWSIRRIKSGHWFVDGPNTPIGGLLCGNEEGAKLVAIRFYRREAERLGVSSQLVGKNLACWCRLCPEHKDGKPFDVTCIACAPCHSDVLGSLANFACHAVR